MGHATDSVLKLLKDGKKRTKNEIAKITKLGSHNVKRTLNKLQYKWNVIDSENKKEKVKTGSVKKLYFMKGKNGKGNQKRDE